MKAPHLIQVPKEGSPFHPTYDNKYTVFYVNPVVLYGHWEKCWIETLTIFVEYIDFFSADEPHKMLPCKLCFAELLVVCLDKDNDVWVVFCSKKLFIFVKQLIRV